MRSELHYPAARRATASAAAMSIRLRHWQWRAFFTRRGTLPLLLLLVALSTVFLFANDRSHFYRPVGHDWLTAQYIAIAENLSPRQGFLPYVYRYRDADGNPYYATYARWPIGSYALVKLAVAPFSDRFTTRIYAARVAMLLLFAAAAVLAYFTLVRISGDRWIALTATLLSFSSYYALFYNDVLAPDVIPALFGILLTAHGMALFEQERRWPQLAVKSCIALLLCWHVYALLLPYIVFGLARQLAARPETDTRRRRGCATGCISTG